MKMASFKDGGGHAKSEAHNNTMLAWAEYERRVHVRESLLLTAVQNIAQRAH